MNKVFAFFLAWLPLAVLAQTDTLRLSLDDCIAMARRQSIDAAVALGELQPDNLSDDCGNERQ